MLVVDFGSESLKKRDQDQPEELEVVDYLQTHVLRVLVGLQSPDQVHSISWVRAVLFGPISKALAGPHS